MDITSIKDPNVVLVEQSAVFDVAAPRKEWYDKRAVDPANTDADFLYFYYAVENGAVVKKRMLLSRAEAGAANCGKVVPSQGANRAVVPMPVRQLGPDESVVLFMGQLTVIKPGAAPSAQGDLLVQLIELVKAIAAKLGV